MNRYFAPGGAAEIAEMAVASDFITRMPPIASIRASVLMPLVQEIDKRSGKTDLLLASHGILRGQLTDPYAVAPMARYIALFEDAASILGEPCLGARLGAASKPADIGPMGVLFSISPTIKAGFRRMAKFVNAVQGATQSGLIEDGETYVWSYRLTDPAMWPRRQDSEYSIAATVELVRSSFHRGWSPLEVHFEHAGPRDPVPLEKIFRAPLRFGQSSNRIVMTKAGADKIHRAEDMGLTAMLERHIADIVGDTDHEPTLAEKVSALIALYLGHRPISTAVLAEELGMSARTLQRRLAEQGLSLRGLVREHRRRLMEQKLAEHMPKARIAEALGYADGTVFWRAAKAWKADKN
jgi:AraC-like DNA-binding protein